MKIITWILLLVGVVAHGRAEAHSLPDSRVLLTVEGTTVHLRFSTPREILELAMQKKIDLHSSSCLDSLRRYFVQHLALSDSLHSTWTIAVENFFTQPAIDPNIGSYEEIVAELRLTPSEARSVTDFIVHGDWIIHQIPNQSMLFFAEKREPAGVVHSQLGVIAMDIPTGKIKPLHIRLAQPQRWEEWKALLLLGMQHIEEGTDHLLFIITLLLPAGLLAENKRWSRVADTRDAIVKLLKIVTAFTAGHSITLLIGVWGWFTLPETFVEVTIALSILVSAIHAIRPLFYNKEIFIALGFGLIHGLAFSQTLQAFDLEPLHLLVSVLAFNLGIEVMQLAVITLIIPWCLLLSRNPAFAYFKNLFALLVSLAAIGWIAQRVTGHENLITSGTETARVFFPWLIGTLVLATLANMLYHKRAGMKEAVD